jgi:hypothetical protein
MSIEVLKDAFIEVDGHDLSDHAHAVTLKNMREVLEATVFGDESKRRISGLGDSSASIELRQDFEAGSVEDVLFPLIGVAVLVVIRKDKTAGASPTNPEYSFVGIFGDLPLVQGGVGALHGTSISLSNADGNVLVRTTT